MDLAAAPILWSFDIDGTLAMGDPQGPLPADFVRHVRAQGCIIGSASDRTLREQGDMWRLAGIEPDFVSAKHQLHRLRERFACRRYVHVGDTLIDAQCAERAAFEFVSVFDMGGPILSRLDAAARLAALAAWFAEQASLG